MEQAVWLWVGIVGIIISFGVIFNSFKDMQSSTEMQLAESALQKYITNLNFVCKSPKDTKISVPIRFPSGLILETDQDRTCFQLGQEIQCLFADCHSSDPYKFDLNTSIALKSFKSETFNCVFEKEDLHVSIDGQG